MEKEHDKYNCEICEDAMREDTPKHTEESWEEKFKNLKFENMRHFGRNADTEMIFKTCVIPLLQEQKDRIVYKIEKYKVKEVKSDFDFEHNITCDDIIKLIKEDK